MLALATCPNGVAMETRGISRAAIDLSVELRRWSMAQPLGPVDLPDPTWAKRTGQVRGGELRISLRSLAFRRPGLGLLRIAELVGAHGLYIANLAFFPEPGSTLPLAQAEFIEVKGRLMLVIADLQDPLDPTRPCGTPLGAVELPPTAERPDWSRRCFSEAALWSTPRTRESLESGKRAMCDLLVSIGLLLSEPRTTVPSLPPLSVAVRLGHYRRLRTTFLEHEPSRPMLHGMFGEAWSEAYMAGFLFPDNPWAPVWAVGPSRSAV